jgi:hypothetical protein
MATLKEMSNVIDSIPTDGHLAWDVQPYYTLDESKHYLRYVMINAEDAWRYYNGVHGEYNKPCTYWMVGDYIITYLTDDEDFHARLLTDDMMDDLIIEER